MAKLKLDYDFDLVVPPSKSTAADRAAVSRALAAHRKTPEYKKALPRIRRMEANLRKRHQDAVASETLANRVNEPDLFIGPSPPYTDADRAAVSRAIAEFRKRPGHTKEVAKLSKTIARLDRANAQANARRTKKKAG